MSDAISDFDSIYAQFRPKLLRYLKRLVGPDDAEDLSQEVFLKIHAGLEGFRGEAALSTWIYRIATNAALDRLRNRSLRETEQVVSYFEAAGDASHASAVTDVAGDAPERSAESLLMRRETNECIRAFVDALPDGYRTVLALRELDGLKNREIAEILGLSIDAVKIRLHRARLALKKRFDAECALYRTEANELACDMKAPAGRSTP